ncbi:MAG TPA: outer membrane beta-barrel protein [Chthoniobacteraceae bacterium]|nr:outer membrane beta-barrel protein [Chthoniobacteraceae bacterium]
MKKFSGKIALIAAATGLICAASPSAYAGTADGENGGSTISTVPLPKFRVSLSILEGYDDNVFTTTDSLATKSWYNTAQADVFADLGNSRTVFTLGVGAGLTYYYSRPGDKSDKLAHLSLDIVHKVNDRLTITFNSYNTYQVQPQFDLQVEQNRVNGQYYYTSQSLSAAYQWTRRFSTVTSYQMTGIFYEEQSAKITNDYIQQTFGNQFRYLLTPTTTAVAEYRFGLVNYLYENALNVTTNYGLVGFDHTFSPRFTMSLRAGGAIQNQKVGGTSTSPYAELTANYQYQRYSAIQGYLNYGFQYSNLAVAQSNKALRIGITDTQAITPKLIATLGFFYEHDDYSSTPSVAGYTDDTLNVNLGLRYPITPKLNIQANYQHVALLSSVASQRYNQNVVSFGANYSF